ncbi:hypothetical protein ACFYNM_39895 [Streptomyces spororaveus]|uniref:hypothetical protein n=1 Tax=Streptomyces spororaveus TaxID=284039 RepID=UPI0036D1BA9A
MGEKKRNQQWVPTAYDVLGRSIAAEILKTSAYEAIFGKVAEQVTDSWARDTFTSPFAGLIVSLGPDPLGLERINEEAARTLRRSITQGAGIGQLFEGLVPTVPVDVSWMVRPNPFRNAVRPLSPQLPGLAEKLAEVLLPQNLQGFSEAEWSLLMEMVMEDGIGVIWAPSKRHLRALLSQPDRETRYAYLHEQREDLFDEVADGLRQVEQEALQDLARLGLRSVDAARVGQWEAALSLATNVVYTAMETKALAWYYEEFNEVRGPKGGPIRGHGVGKTVTAILDTVPLPARRVGIFELRSHLVIRPLSETFAASETVDGKHNRHAVCHKASYDSIREDYLIPVLLNMHAVLRGLDEKMTDDEREMS